MTQLDEGRGESGESIFFIDRFSSKRKLFLVVVSQGIVVT